MKIKKIDYFFFIFALLVIISCSSDDNGDSPIDETKLENLKPLGTSASDLLSQNTYASLTVEIAYNQGYKPTQETLDTFRTFLEERVNKPNGIVFVETEIESPFEESQSLAEIRALENDQRNYYTIEDDIAIFIYFTRSNADTDTEATVTLGTAYLNTSIVIYEKTLREVSQSQNVDLFLLEENYFTT